MRRMLLPWMVAVLTGCYTLQPVESVVHAGNPVAFDLNDAGRAAMAARVGPEITQVEGRLISSEPDDYVLAVRSVRFFRGGDQTWVGEPVTISRSHVARTYERRFSKGRTAALTAVVLASVVAVFVTSLAVIGDEPGPDGKDPDGEGTLFIWPLAGLKP